MAALISCSSLEKSFGGQPLFKGIALNVEEGERIGVLGPNGSGKSTLLKILVGLESSDSGTITRKRGLKLAYLPQEENFRPTSTIREILFEALADEHLSEEEQWSRVGSVTSVIGISDLEQTAGVLSGGWRKRVALATKLIVQPEILLLDEPTNHLDLEGITWLEQFILEADCAIVIISHDRTLLENVSSRIFELNRIYPEGCYTTEGNYSKFLERREEFLQGIARYEDALRNKVRREIEWLRRGPKARTTKAKGRIKGAEKLINELQAYESRSSNQATSDIDFLASGRRTKKLIEVKDVSQKYGEHILFQDLSFVLSPGMRVGIVGANGSGKSTLLKVLDGSLVPQSGTVFQAPELKVVKFDQSRDLLDKTVSLKKALSPDGENVIYQGRELHVASWARRFLFRSEQLQMPVRSLSGGEQARLLIAKLMLQPADVLLLDEPTNDLDIDTLQVLEESLEEFPGAIVLVTHDRFMLDRVSTTVLGLRGQGEAEFFASYAQWEEFLQDSPNQPSADAWDLTISKSSNGKSDKADKSEPSNNSKSISKDERKKLVSIERKIEKVELELKDLKHKLTQSDFSGEPTTLHQLCSQVQVKESELEKLMSEWSEIAERA